jgi:hypothetical protein
MPDNTNAILIAGSGSVYTAVVGTPLPTTPTVALNAAFVDMGLIHEDGFTWRFDKTAEPIMVWGSFYAVKYRVTEATAEQEFTLKQFDRHTLPFAMGGGTVVAMAGPPEYFVFTPADPEDIDERALVIDWLYSASTYRLVVPRVMVTSGAELTFSDNAETDLPCTVGLMGTPGVSAYTMYTNDPAFDPTP